MKMAMFFQGSKNDHCFHDLMYVILKIIILELKLIDDIKRNWNLCQKNKFVHKNLITLIHAINI